VMGHGSLLFEGHAIKIAILFAVLRPSIFYRRN